MTQQNSMSIIIIIIIWPERNFLGLQPSQLARIRQMSGQVSRGSGGEYQADERAGVAWLSW